MRYKIKKKSYPLQEKIRLEWQDVYSVVDKKEDALYFILDRTKMIVYVLYNSISKILIKGYIAAFFISVSPLLSVHLLWH